VGNKTSKVLGSQTLFFNLIIVQKGLAFPEGETSI